MPSSPKHTKRSPRDHYVTPHWCIRAMVSQLEFAGYGRMFRVLDAGAGDGRIGSAFAAQGATAHYVDIEPQAAFVSKRDFLEMDVRSYDLVVMNPPFSHALDFVKHGLQARGCIALLSMGMMESKGRVPFWREHPPTHVRVLCPRPSFRGGGTDSTAYAWFYWVPRKFMRRKGVPWSWALREENQDE